MPIPRFNEDGLLPPGIHRATLDEVIARFGGPSEQRVAIAESLRWAVDAARRAGVLRFIIDGSFIDDKDEPNDADCAVLLRERTATHELKAGFPYLDLILFDDALDFDRFVYLQYTEDRYGRNRGIIELELPKN
jgi:hypothetical protein